MAEVTAIAWTDATFNPWKICTPVGPGCKNCYAAALARRYGWGEYAQGVPRQRTAAANWRKPLAWQRHAENGMLPDGKTPHGGRRPRVFCASLADVFDNEAPEEWRRDLWDLIERTPNLTWLLLTKRIGNAMRMLRTHDWAASSSWNVWLGATIVNQDEADRDVPKLLATPAAVHFVSYEPALDDVDWRAFKGLDWLIIGGESTQGATARIFKTTWALNAISDCQKIGAAPFVKQLGSAAFIDAERLRLKDRAGADPDEWPAGLRVREFPHG